MPTCLAAAPDYARHYRREYLDAADLARLRACAGIEARSDWRTSRALKQQASYTRSLAHSRGHAAILTGLDPQQPAGVDIEAVRLRDFAALGAWIATPEECRWQAQHPDPAAAFYALWTLKEAVIKACNLDFPADMPHVGISVSDRGTGLRGIGILSGWQVKTFVLNNFVLTCVWQGCGNQTLDLQLLGKMAEAPVEAFVW